MHFYNQLLINKLGHINLNIVLLHWVRYFSYIKLRNIEHKESQTNEKYYILFIICIEYFDFN